jgi:homoserine kinase type II
MISQASVEIENILQNYQIGDLVYYKQDERGYNNTNFAIETELHGQRQKYFFRRYKCGIKKEELIFEHSVINHLVKRNFDLVPRIIKTRNKKSYVHQIDRLDAGNGVFYAIFEFLTGEDKYTWINPLCSAEEIVNAAFVLGRFHNAVYDFIPEGRRYEPKIHDLLPVVYLNAIKSVERGTDSVFDVYLAETIDLIKRNIKQTQDGLSKQDCQDLIELVNHCDYHPGNLKFQNKQVVALLDFDWSKIEVRCFDVALAIFYFFTDWEADRDGQIRLDQAALFLKTYQDTLRGHPGLAPLNEAELKCLPFMLNASNLYVLNWTLLDYLNKPVDPVEFQIYLRHGVNLIKWLEVPANRNNLESVWNSAVQ